MRRLFVVIAVLLAGSAWAVSPGQRGLLFAARPVFQVDLTQGVLPPQIIFSRASDATYFNSAGLLTTATTNIPRFDYNPSTLAPLGLEIEESRTNVTIWNRDLTNAAWTKTNVTAAKDQTGIDGVANSASSILATAGNGTALQAITLASSQRFQTAYVQRIAGSGVVNMTTDGGTTWTVITVPPAGTWGRVSIAAQTVTNPSVGFRLVTNADKIAVDFVQNETGATATSAIATTTASVTRSADIPTLTGGLITALQGNTGSVVIEAQVSGIPINNSRLVGLSASGQAPLYMPNNTLAGTFNGSVVLSATLGSSGTWLGKSRGAVGWSPAGRSVVGNGGTVVTDANSIAPTAWTAAYLGSNAGGSSFADGWIAKIAFYNTRLLDAQLQARSVVGAPF